MEKTHSGLFAFQLVTRTPSVPEPGGAYDPIEQLWRDEGLVTACSGLNGQCATVQCCSPLLCEDGVICVTCFAPTSLCTDNSECCSGLCQAFLSVCA